MAWARESGVEACLLQGQTSIVIGVIAMPNSWVMTGEVSASDMHDPAAE